MLLKKDPRVFQIGTLSSLLFFLLAYNDFVPSASVIILTLVGACLTQLACGLIFQKTINVDYKSPLITGLSLCLLFKASILWLHPLAASAAIASKFLFRINDKHIFNPANFAIVIGLILLPHDIWVSPAQWGSTLWLAFALISAALLVLTTARRGDISLFFLICWALLIFGRALWLGDPLSIPLHQLQSGALLIFAFFMLSDPKTTPDHHIGRFIFAAMVASLAFILQFTFQIREGLFFALFLICLLTPIIDRLLIEQRYQWRTI